MNLIQRQAEDFLKYQLQYTHKPAKYFIENVRTQLLEYRKATHRIEFIEYIKDQVKEEYDSHLKECTKGPTCEINRFCEDTLFFLQEEIEELEETLSPIEFRSSQKHELSESLKIILDDLNRLKLGQEITYNDLYAAIQESKDYYFLNKKNWVQLLAGKLAEMAAGGIVSETISKDIVKLVIEKYNEFKA